MTIRQTPEKAVGFKTACHALLTNPSPTIRELARVVGKIVSPFPGVMNGPLHYRFLERDKILALQTIWLWCIPHKIWLSAAHIAGKCNIQADLESRHSVTETEWMLNNTLLSNSLGELDFTPEINLFVSRLNAQFPRYVAYRPVPGAWSVDAFTIGWSVLNFYTFPPGVQYNFGSTEEDKGGKSHRLKCILSHWPTQAWFQKMAVRKSAVLPLSRSPPHIHLESWWMVQGRDLC